ncbi:hypothetical protein DL93DRAFT_2092240, partial [Clavulina sp. PMI_390]
MRATLIGVAASLCFVFVDHDVIPAPATPQRRRTSELSPRGDLRRDHHLNDYPLHHHTDARSAFWRFRVAVPLFIKHDDADPRLEQANHALTVCFPTTPLHAVPCVNGFT